MPPPPKGNQETMLDKAIGKASGLWAGFGKAPEGNWKVCLCIFIWLLSFTAYFVYREGCLFMERNL